MRRPDLAVAAVFLLLGAFLVTAAFRFPAGVGRLPGPGFFPGVVGATMLLLAGLLGVAAARGGGSLEFRLQNPRALGLTVALVAAYLALWGVVPFALRTGLFVAVFLRLLGVPARTALAVAAVVTAAVIGAFQYGLRIDLD